MNATTISKAITADGFEMQTLSVQRRIATVRVRAAGSNGAWHMVNVRPSYTSNGPSVRSSLAPKACAAVKANLAKLGIVAHSAAIAQA